MQERIQNILNQAISLEEFKYIHGYRQLNGPYQFELETFYTEYGHQTFLKYIPTDDLEFVRIEIKHRFGFLDVDREFEVTAKQLMLLLERNVGQFQGTSSFIGVEYEDQADIFYAVLGSVHHFVTSWSDEDIANALTLHIFDMTMGLAVKDSSLTILKFFGDS